MTTRRVFHLIAPRRCRLGVGWWWSPFILRGLRDPFVRFFLQYRTWYRQPQKFHLQDRSLDHPFIQLPSICCPRVNRNRHSVWAYITFYVQINFLSYWLLLKLSNSHIHEFGHIYLLLLHEKINHLWYIQIFKIKKLVAFQFILSQTSHSIHFSSSF